MGIDTSPDVFGNAHIRIMECVGDIYNHIQKESINEGRIEKE